MLLPLIYDVKLISIKSFTKYEVSIFPQPGEVSFPGGRVEDGETFQEAAIRETCEELNLSPDQIDIWERLII